MNRKTFFRNLAALGVAVGIAPKVLAEKEPDRHVFNVELLEKRKRELERAPKKIDPVFKAQSVEALGARFRLNMDVRHLLPYDALEEIDDNHQPTGRAYLVVLRDIDLKYVEVRPVHTDFEPKHTTFFHFASYFREK